MRAECGRDATGGAPARRAAGAAWPLAALVPLAPAASSHRSCLPSGPAGSLLWAARQHQSRAGRADRAAHAHGGAMGSNPGAGRASRQGGAPHAPASTSHPGGHRLDDAAQRALAGHSCALRCLQNDRVTLLPLAQAGHLGGHPRHPSSLARSRTHLTKWHCRATMRRKERVITQAQNTWPGVGGACVFHVVRHTSGTASGTDPGIHVTCIAVTYSTTIV